MLKIFLFACLCIPQIHLFYIFLHSGYIFGRPGWPPYNWWGKIWCGSQCGSLGWYFNLQFYISILIWIWIIWWICMIILFLKLYNFFRWIMSNVFYHFIICTSLSKWYKGMWFVPWHYKHFSSTLFGVIYNRKEIARQMMQSIYLVVYIIQITNKSQIILASYADII